MGIVVFEKPKRKPPNLVYRPRIWQDNMQEVKETFRRVAEVKYSGFSVWDPNIPTSSLLSWNRRMRNNTQMPRSLPISRKYLKEIQNNRSFSPFVVASHLQNVRGMCRRIQSQDSVTERKKNRYDVSIYPSFVRRPCRDAYFLEPKKGNTLFRKSRPKTAPAAPFSYSPPEFKLLYDISNNIFPTSPLQRRPASPGSTSDRSYSRRHVSRRPYTTTHGRPASAGLICKRGPDKKKGLTICTPDLSSDASSMWSNASSGKAVNDVEYTVGGSRETHQLRQFRKAENWSPSDQRDVPRRLVERPPSRCMNRPMADRPWSQSQSSFDDADDDPSVCSTSAGRESVVVLTPRSSTSYLAEVVEVPSDRYLSPQKEMIRDDEAVTYPGSSTRFSEQPLHPRARSLLLASSSIPSGSFTTPHTLARCNQFERRPFRPDPFTRPQTPARSGQLEISAVDPDSSRRPQMPARPTLHPDFLSDESMPGTPAKFPDSEISTSQLDSPARLSDLSLSQTPVSSLAVNKQQRVSFQMGAQKEPTFLKREGSESERRGHVEVSSLHPDSMTDQCLFGTPAKSPDSEISTSQLDSPARLSDLSLSQTPVSSLTVNKQQRVSFQMDAQKEPTFLKRKGSESERRGHVEVSALHPDSMTHQCLPGTLAKSLDSETSTSQPDSSTRLLALSLIQAPVSCSTVNKQQELPSQIGAKKELTLNRKGSESSQRRGHVDLSALHSYSLTDQSLPGTPVKSLDLKTSISQLDASTRLSDLPLIQTSVSSSTVNKQQGAPYQMGAHNELTSLKRKGSELAQRHGDLELSELHPTPLIDQFLPGTPAKSPGSETTTSQVDSSTRLSNLTLTQTTVSSRTVNEQQGVPSQIDARKELTFLKRERSESAQRHEQLELSALHQDSLADQSLPGTPAKSPGSKTDSSTRLSDLSLTQTPVSSSTINKQQGVPSQIGAQKEVTFLKQEESESAQNMAESETGQKGIDIQKEALAEKQGTSKVAAKKKRYSAISRLSTTAGGLGRADRDSLYPVLKGRPKSASMIQKRNSKVTFTSPLSSRFETPAVKSPVASKRSITGGEPRRKSTKQSNTAREVLATARPYSPYGGDVIIKQSSDPFIDFSNSMMEMIESEGLHVGDPALEDLFQYYLDLNPASHHTVILAAIRDIKKAMEKTNRAR